jgi:hypothetical protein
VRLQERWRRADGLIDWQSRRSEVTVICEIFYIDAFLSTSHAPRAWPLSVTSLFRLGAGTTRLSPRPISGPGLI